MDESYNITIGDKIGLIIEIENELKGIMEIVYANNKHIEVSVLKNDPTKWKTLNEKKRGVMGLWSQSIERKLQETSISYLVEYMNFKIEEIIPSQDGFMILKKNYYEHIIQDIEKAVLDKYNINLQYKEKSFDERYEIPLYIEEKTFSDWEDTISCKKLADRFIEEFGKFVCFGKGEDVGDRGVQYYVFNSEKQKLEIVVNGKNIEIFIRDIEKGRWYLETKDGIHPKLTLFISEDLYSSIQREIAGAVELLDEEYTKLEKRLRIHTSEMNNKIILHILPKIRVSTEEFNSNPYIIGFENGVFDLLQDCIRPYTPNDYITLSTGYNYIKPEYGLDEEGHDIICNFSEELQTVIFKNRVLQGELNSIFETIMPNLEERKLLYQILASGLDGRLYQKIFCFVGKGGNGKTLIHKLMEKSLGKEYFKIASNGLLTDLGKANGPAPDMIDLKNARYVVFSELEGDIKSSVLRKLSGSNKITARGMFAKTNDSFNIQASFAMEFNNPPQLSGKPMESDYRRIVHLQFPINFTTNPDKIDKVIGGIQFRKANLRYGQPEFHEEMKYVFFDFLRSVYKTYRNKEDESIGMMFDVPDSVTARSNKFLEDQDLFTKAFFDQWEIVGIKKNEDGQEDKADRKMKSVKLKEVWNSIENSKDYKALSAREKREYSRDEFTKWIEDKCIIDTDKMNHCRILVGIQKKYAEEDGEIDKNLVMMFSY